MRGLAAGVIVCFACAVLCSGTAKAQGRAATDWMTSNGDAQRSSWIRTDTKISKETMQKPGFKFLWKLKLKNDPKQLNSLTPPALLDLLIGYRGFRTLAFVGGSSDNIFVIDTDLGRMEWQKHFSSNAPQAGSAPAQVGSLACPGGMTANVTRPTIAAVPSLSAGGGGRGRRSPARSDVGGPGQGAVTLAQVAAAPPPTPAAPPPPSAPPPAPPGSNIFGRGPFLVYALSSDGMLHTMHLSNGTDAEPPVKFLPPNANAHGLIVIDNVAYVVTEQGCGGAPNGVWALDLASKQVTTWRANIAGSAGPAFSGDGTLYVTTGAGEESPFSLVALEPKTLKVKGRYTAEKQEFTSSPVVFEYKGKILIAATTKDGRMHLLDSASLSGGDHQNPLYKTQTYSKVGDIGPGALASWQGSDGTRWVLASIEGPAAPDVGFTATSGKVTRGAILAWKVMEQNGAPTLQPGWVSRDLVSPLPPTIINGVVFAVSSGEFRTNDSKITAAQRAQRSSPAVLYALDAATGKELWNSGATITSFVRGGAWSGGGGQFYLGTYDGTLYAFGFPMEH
jgi:outer membrane protein assembly factor BamB